MKNNKIKYSFVNLKTGKSISHTQVKQTKINMLKPEEKQKTLKPAFFHNISNKDKHDKFYYHGE